MFQEKKKEKKTIVFIQAIEHLCQLIVSLGLYSLEKHTDLILSYTLIEFISFRNFKELFRN